MSDREAKFWTCIQDEEELRHDDPTEAVQEYIDNMGLCDLASMETIAIYGFAPLRIHPNDIDVERAIEDILERLDEEYGNWMGDDQSTPTPGMLTAGEQLRAAILADYRAWACEKVCEEEVNVREWLAEWEPELLGEVNAWLGIP